METLGFLKKRDDDYPWMIGFSDIDYNVHFVQYVYICIEPAGQHFSSGQY